MSKTLKITSIFKEKKKSHKRCTMKDGDEIDSEEEKFKELETHQIQNKKIKFLYPKSKPRKNKKTLKNLKYEKTDEQSNESKSTQAWSKKFDDICERLIKVLDSKGNSRSAECYREAKAIHNMLDEIHYFL